MKSGTSYEHKNGQNARERYYECPKCHYKKYDSVFSFYKLLSKEKQK